MEPTNHPFRKEHDLNQTPMIMFYVNLPGCRNYPKGHSLAIPTSQDHFVGMHDTQGLAWHPSSSSTEEMVGSVLEKMLKVRYKVGPKTCYRWGEITSISYK